MAKDKKSGILLLIIGALVLMAFTKRKRGGIVTVEDLPSGQLVAKKGSKIYSTNTGMPFFTFDIDTWIEILDDNVDDYYALVQTLDGQKKGYLFYIDMKTI